MRKFFALLMVLVFVFMSSLSFAGGRELTFEKFQNLSSLGATPADADEIPVFDASGIEVKRVLFTRLPGGSAFEGNVVFQTTIIASGRINAASTAASSSTNLAPANLPYSILRKFIGGAGGLDETDGGTRLQNAKPGQVMVFIIAEAGATGSWIITPNTSLVIDTITMNSKGDMVALRYFDDTIGWTLISNDGAVIVYNTITGIPAIP